MNAIEDAKAMLRMAYLDFRALTGMENRDIFAVQARYEEGLLFTEEPLDRPSLITEVQDLLEHVEQTIQSSKPQ